MKARELLEAESRRPAVRNELAAVLERRNTATDGTLAYAGEYLTVVGPERWTGDSTGAAPCGERRQRLGEEATRSASRTSPGPRAGHVRCHDRGSASAGRLALPGWVTRSLRWRIPLAAAPGSSGLTITDPLNRGVTGNHASSRQSLDADATALL